MKLHIASGLRAFSVHAAAAVLIASAAGTAGVDAIQQTSGRPRPATSSSSDGGLPPIIDRELFFGNPEVSSGTLSPDGKYMAFRKPWNETMNIWVKGVAEPFAQAKRLTAEAKRPIPKWAARLRRWSCRSRSCKSQEIVHRQYAVRCTDTVRQDEDSGDR